MPIVDPDPFVSWRLFRRNEEKLKRGSQKITSAWTQEWVAEQVRNQVGHRIDISVHDIINIEHGRSIAIEKIYAICKFFDIEYDHVMVPDHGIKIATPNKIDFRAANNNAENMPFEMLYSEPVAVTLLKLEVRNFLHNQCELHDMKIYLPDIDQDQYSWYYVVQLMPGSPGHLGIVASRSTTIINKGIFSEEIMCIAPRKDQIKWKDFQLRARNIPGGILNVIAEFDFLVKNKAGIKLSYNWKIPVSEIRECMEFCRKNPENLCNFIQPELLDKGWGIKYNLPQPVYIA